MTEILSILIFLILLVIDIGTYFIDNSYLFWVMNFVNFMFFLDIFFCCLFIYKINKFERNKELKKQKLNI